MSISQAQWDELVAECEALRTRVAELEREDATRHKQYQRVLESLPQRVFLKDLESRFLLVNEPFARLFGQTVERLVGKTDFDICPHDLAVKYRNDDQRVMRSKHAVTLIEPNDSGTTRTFVEVTKAPVFDDDGKVNGVVGIFTDVTARVRAESQLRQSRRLLQAILDNTPAIITIKDSAGRYVLVNRRFNEVFGFHERNVVGKTDHELFPSSNAKQYRKHDEIVFATGKSIEVEEQVPLSDGHHTFIVLKFPVETSEGAVLSVGGISTDITERKRSEERISESETRKSAILDAALDCIITLDHEGRITEFNPSAEREFGCSRDLALSQQLDEFLDMEESSEINWSAILSGQRLATVDHHVEVVAKRHDQSRFTAEMGMTVTIVGGKPQTTVTLRNITKRKEAEEAIRKQQQQLSVQAQQLEQRNKDLSKAYEELQDTEAQLIHSEKMAAIGQLVAGLAHEVNTPVAFVLTNLSNIGRNSDDVMAFAREVLALKPKLESAHPQLAAKLTSLASEYQVEEAASELHPLLDAAQKGMVRIRDLVANLRSYSRIDLRSQTAFEDLNEGIRATLVLLQPLRNKYPDIKVQVELGDIPRLECNLGQVNQVFLNLISNAAQSLGEKGTIWVTTQTARNGVEVVVRDDGPGIPPEIQKRIFDPFFTTKPVGQGTGLGLSISRRIVESHAGSLTFTSKPGVGTEFHLWLPLSQKPQSV